MSRYLDSMSASGLDDFLLACDNIKNCKYVLAETRIAALLKTIADNRQLYSMFAAALYGFDYTKSFSDCIVGSSFVLPSEPKIAVAVVFRVLLDIDSGKMPLQKFLEAYFSGETVNESYARFTLEVITPFETYCKMLYAKAEQSPSGVFDEQEAQMYDDDSAKLDEKLRTDARMCVAALMDIAEQTIDGSVDRDEFLACVKGLKRALDADNEDNIISAFLGVKYAVSYFFKSSDTVAAIFKKLDYDIKHLSA